MSRTYSERNVNGIARKSRAYRMPMKPDRHFIPAPWDFNIAPNHSEGGRVYWEINSSEGAHICQVSSSGGNPPKTEKANFDIIRNAPLLYAIAEELVRETCYKHCLQAMTAAERRVCVQCQNIYRAKTILADCRGECDL